jgi:hypothetical protein
MGEDTITYDVPAGYTLQINRKRSFGGRRRWILLGPAVPTGFTVPALIRPIVAAGIIDPLNAIPQDWIALGFAPDAARAAIEATEQAAG